MGVVAVSDAPLHVLAVDDSNLDRKLIERLLKTSSYHVTAVDSGSKALEFLGLQDVEKLSSFDPEYCHPEVEVNLIITDYCMPGMTGFELLRKIKESTSLKDIPVVIMSSENVPARINRCLEEGAEEFFLKPVQLSDVDKLKPYLSKNKRKTTDEEECLSNEKSRARVSTNEMKAGEGKGSVGGRGGVGGRGEGEGDSCGTTKERRSCFAGGTTKATTNIDGDSCGNEGTTTTNNDRDSCGTTTATCGSRETKSSIGQTVIRFQ